MAKKYNYIQQAVDCITNLDDFHPKEIIGCTEDEINNLEKLLGEHYYIPEAYVEFLEWGGHGIVEMLSRANFYYSKIYDDLFGFQYI